jgi:phosphohistidine phosphatase
MPAGADGDAGRSLSPEGRDAIGRLAKRLARERWRPSSAFSSPLVRARETAGLLSHAVPGGLEIAALEQLAPERGADELLEALSHALAEGARALLVGHQPLLGDLVTLLCGKPTALRPGSLIRLEAAERLAPRAAVLRLELHPPDYD